MNCWGPWVSSLRLCEHQLACVCVCEFCVCIDGGVNSGSCKRRNLAGAWVCRYLTGQCHQLSAGFRFSGVIFVQRDGWTCGGDTHSRPRGKRKHNKFTTHTKTPNGKEKNAIWCKFSFDHKKSNGPSSMNDTSKWLFFLYFELSMYVFYWICPLKAYVFINECFKMINWWYRSFTNN